MKDIFLFNNVDINQYKNYIKIKDVKSNTLLFSEGEKCNSLGIVLNGEIKISTLTPMHKEYIINFLNKGDIFGDVLLFSNDNTYLGDGIAVKDSKIVYISKKNLLMLLKNQTILENYLKMLAEKTTSINSRLKLFSQNSIEDKIMFYLSNESKKINSNTIPITSKESLANILNIPRPSLSRELINLKNKGLITYNRKHITITKI